MSRSKRLPVIKDKGISTHKYWRTIRRVQKQAIRTGKDIPDKRAIINDYDRCDFIINYMYNNSNRAFWMNGHVVEGNEYIIKSTRK